MASDPWIDAPGWGYARGQNLGHFIDFFKTIFFSFIESSVFAQQVLYWTDFLCVTSDIRAHDPMWGKRSKSRTPLKCYYIFLTYADILKKALESFHIWAFVTIHGRLSLNT